MPRPHGPTRRFDRELIDQSLTQYEVVKFKEILATSEDTQIVKLVTELKGAANFAKYLLSQIAE